MLLTASRVVFESASIVLTLKLGRDIYEDRANLSELWRAPRSYKPARVLRVAGFLNALIGVIIQCVLLRACAAFSTTNVFLLIPGTVCEYPTLLRSLTLSHMHSDRSEF